MKYILSQAMRSNYYLYQSFGRQILLASEIVVFLGILFSFQFIIPYSVPQYVCSGLIMFVAAEVLEGNIPQIIIHDKRHNRKIKKICTSTNYSILCNGITAGVNLSLLSRVMSSRLSRGTYNGGLLSTEAGTIARVIADATITIGGYFGQSHLLNITLLPSLLICIGSIVATCCTYNSLY